MEKVWKEFEKWYSVDPVEKKMTSKGYTAEGFQAGWKAAQHSMHLTAFGVVLLAFLAGFGICWLVFVR